MNNRYTVAMARFIAFIQNIQAGIIDQLAAHPLRWSLAAKLVLLLPLAALVGSYNIITNNKVYILDQHNVPQVMATRSTVGLVLGAGITKDGKPYRELQSRLDSAAEAFQRGEVKELIVSGDNRFHNYDEPTAMKQYLVAQRHIDPAKIQPDFAGRSTYESCQRAADVFGVRETIIFSAPSHLPRAIYLCRQFGIQAYGIASSVEANNAGRREALARVKALYNVYIRGENTILGPAISL